MWVGIQALPLTRCAAEGPCESDFTSEMLPRPKVGLRYQKMWRKPTLDRNSKYLPMTGITY